MLFFRLWNYVRGYVVIRVEGLSLEKFINLSVSTGVHLWRIRRIHHTALTACVSIAGFHRLHAVTRKLHCRVRIVEKRGLPFTAHRVRNRKMLVYGMVLFVALLFGFSSFIWTVDVEGTERVPAERIVEELAGIGVRPGVFKAGLDILAIENRMLINLPELSWLSLEIRGSRAIVRVAESVPPPRIIDKSIPANLIAKKDGIVHRMIVLEGEAVVKIGQTVQSGQLLVSGVIDHPDTTGIRYVHSMGQILARTWYEGQSAVSLREPLRRRTGASAEAKYIEVGELQIFYQQADIPFEHYDLILREEPFFPHGRYLPITAVVATYYEVIEIPLEQNLDAAKEWAEHLALQEVRKMMPPGAKVIDKQLKYDIIEGEAVTLVLYVEALEDIALQQRIDVLAE